MFKPRKKRDKSSHSAPPSENLSDILNSCEAALELTRKHNEPKHECSSDFDDDDLDEDDDDDYDESQENTMNEDLAPPKEPTRVKDTPDLCKDSSKPAMDEALNLYRDLPSEDEDNQNSNEDTTINDMLDQGAHQQTAPPAGAPASQFPFSFAPRVEDQPPSGGNFPLTSAFTAHPQSSLLNFFNTTGKNRGGGALPTSAMLVEAALNSVSDASNEFIDSVTEENNIDIESVSKPPIRNPAFSDNSADDVDFGNDKNGGGGGHTSISGSSAASIESKKLDVVPFSVKKHFENNFEDERDFAACRGQGFIQPQREFYNTHDNETELNFAGLSHSDYKKYDKCFQYLEEMKNLNESLKEQKRDVLSAESVDCHFQATASKIKPDDLHKLLPNELDLKFKRKEEDFR